MQALLVCRLCKHDDGTTVYYVCTTHAPGKTTQTHTRTEQHVSHEPACTCSLAVSRKCRSDGDHIKLSMCQSMCFDGEHIGLFKRIHIKQSHERLRARPRHSLWLPWQSAAGDSTDFNQKPPSRTCIDVCVGTQGYNSDTKVACCKNTANKDNLILHPSRSTNMT